MRQSKLFIAFIFSVALSLNAFALMPGMLYISGLSQLGQTESTIFFA